MAYTVEARCETKAAGVDNAVKTLFRASKVEYVKPGQEPKEKILRGIRPAPRSLAKQSTLRDEVRVRGRRKHRRGTMRIGQIRASWRLTEQAKSFAGFLPVTLSGDGEKEVKARNSGEN
jgi:hypothetical protein